MPYLCYLNNYNIFLRESSRKLYSKTSQITQVTRNLGSICCNTPKDSTPKDFYIKNEYFLNNYLDKILAKYSPKITKLQNFKKFSRGSMPPNPPSKRVASPRAAWRFAPCKYPHFFRKILNPPPK